MKLLARYNRVTLATTIVVMLITGIIYYVAIKLILINDVDKDLLSNLIRWLGDLEFYFSPSGGKRYLDELFYDYQSLWDHVALIFQRLLNRS